MCSVHSYRRTRNKETMKTKDKAKELVDKYQYNCKHTEYVDDNRYKHNDTIKLINAKYCALICVDEIINTSPCMAWLDMVEHLDYNKSKEYWQEVKQEIEKL